MKLGYLSQDDGAHVMVPRTSGPWNPVHDATVWNPKSWDPRSKILGITLKGSQPDYRFVPGLK